MLEHVSKTFNLLRNQGLASFIKRSGEIVYETATPRVRVSYNGVTVRAGHAFDTIIPWRVTDRPQYEAGLVAGIESAVEETDTVVIVGGGWGVSTVVAARQTGSDDKVHTFEAASDSVKKVQDTVALNSVANCVTITHAIVAEEISTRGSTEDAKLISPADLPDCDVLVLDCEGAELSIIAGMDTLPRTIIVETHGYLGAPVSEVREQLTSHGYTVTNEEIAEPDQKDFCLNNDIYVLQGHQE